MSRDEIKVYVIGGDQLLDRQTAEINFCGNRSLCPLVGDISDLIRFAIYGFQVFHQMTGQHEQSRVGPNRHVIQFMSPQNGILPVDLIDGIGKLDNMLHGGLDRRKRRMNGHGIDVPLAESPACLVPKFVGE